MDPFVDQYGRAISLTTFGITDYAVVVVAVNLRIAAMCHFWIVLHYILIFGSILVDPVVVVVVAAVGVDMNIYHTGYLAFTLQNCHC
jgi:multisubunit Na+/H+ antiporter MnhG subunit